MIRGIDTDDQRGFGQLDDPVELALGQTRGDGRGRGADLPRRDRRREELDAVGQGEHHDVALAHTEAGKRLRGIDRESLELDTGDGSVLVGDRGMTGIGGREVGKLAGIRDHGHPGILTDLSRARKVPARP